MKKLLISLAMLLLTLGLATPVSAQCGNCAPGVKTGYTPGSAMTVYLDSSLTDQEYSAAVNAVAAWNQSFEQQGAAPPYSFTNNAFAANINIKEDPTLHNTGYPGSTNASAGIITTNPDYKNRTDGFLDNVLSHEIGHAIGFTDVNTSTCQGQTVMFGSITVGGSYTTGPTSTDRCQLSQYCPPSGTGNGDALSQCDPEWGCAEPILLNLGHGGYRLTGMEDPVSFDIFGVGPRGGKPQIGWTERGAEVAFLSFDRNGNGLIDNGGELFGTGTLLRSGQHAANGFDALSEYDDNRDGQIDSSDQIWQYLLLWTDRNHDGISQPAELTPIGASMVTAIELAHRWTYRQDWSGNYFGYEGRFHEGREVRPFYDVFFVIRH